MLILFMFLSFLLQVYDFFHFEVFILFLFIVFMLFIRFCFLFSFCCVFFVVVTYTFLCTCCTHAFHDYASFYAYAHFLFIYTLFMLYFYLHSLLVLCFFFFSLCNFGLFSFMFILFYGFIVLFMLMRYLCFLLIYFLHAQALFISFMFFHSFFFFHSLQICTVRKSHLKCQQLHHMNISKQSALTDLYWKFFEKIIFFSKSSQLQYDSYNECLCLFSEDKSRDLDLSFILDLPNPWIDQIILAAFFGCNFPGLSTQTIN